MIELQYTQEEYDEFKDLKDHYEHNVKTLIQIFLMISSSTHKMDSYYFMQKKLFHNPEIRDNNYEQTHFVNALEGIDIVAVGKKLKFFLRSSIDNTADENYLNYSKDENRYLLSDPDSRNGYKTQFTQSEIDKIIVDHPEVKYFRKILA
ncbi:hypothetical protein vBOeSunk162_46 [Oenococcus phage vB_OeS_unk162]|nr:hypothetical protein vBOeSunk162_46 [Oenococcus phage vB_OeS_unk162]